MATIDLETTKDQARKLLNSRIASVTDLVIARKRVDELREQLAEAEREDKRRTSEQRRTAGVKTS